MKSANWISAIGISPFRAAPIATPTIADSASGVSSTRASPKRSYRPSVAPKTPPLRPTSSPSTRTRSSRSISSVMAARTASIIRIPGTTTDCRAVWRYVVRWRPARCTSRVRLQGEEGKVKITFLEVRDFVLGGGQERDGGASASKALLSAERAARRLLRVTRPPAWQRAWSFGVFLFATKRGGAQGGAARQGGRTHGSQIPGRENAQADVLFHRARAAQRSGRCFHAAAGAGSARRRVRSQGAAARIVPRLRVGQRAQHALPPRIRRAHEVLGLGDLAGRMKVSKSAVNHRLRRLQQVAGSNGGSRSTNAAPPNI